MIYPLWWLLSEIVCNAAGTTTTSPALGRDGNWLPTPLTAGSECILFEGPSMLCCRGKGG